MQHKNHTVTSAPFKVVQVSTLTGRLSVPVSRNVLYFFTLPL